MQKSKKVAAESRNLPDTDRYRTTAAVHATNTTQYLSSDFIWEKSRMSIKQRGKKTLFLCLRREGRWGEGRRKALIDAFSNTSWMGKRTEGVCVCEIPFRSCLCLPLASDESGKKMYRAGGGDNKCRFPLLPPIPENPFPEIFFAATVFFPPPYFWVLEAEEAKSFPPYLCFFCESYTGNRGGGNGNFG